MGRKDTFENLSQNNSKNNVLDRFNKFSLDNEKIDIPETEEKPSEEAEVVEDPKETNENEIRQDSVEVTPTLSKETPEIDVTEEYKVKEPTVPATTFFKKKNVSVQRSWKAWEQVDDALNDIFRDKKGRLKPGAKGEITNLMNNAVISELVKIGYFDKDKLNDRVDYEGW